jgi:ribosomal-protein-alanine N-acetyltransferase
MNHSASEHQIRPATPKDAKAIVQIHYDAVHVTGAASYPQEILDRWDIGVTPERVRHMERNILSEDELYYVADIKGRAVGFTTVVPKNNELRAVYVHSQFGRRGIGKALLMAAEGFAKSSNLSHLWLRSSLNAHDFYLKNGYESLHPAYHSWGPAKMSCFAMRKVLSASYIDPIPTLKTERLILRPLRLEDAPSVFAYAKNPNVSRYTLWEPHNTLQDTEAFLWDYAFESYGRQSPEPLGITLKSNPEKVVGTVGCYWVSKPSKSMELAYAISEDLWGQGYVVEASSALLNFVFQKLNVHRVTAHCKVENTASERVMQKLGFTFEGTKRQAVFHRNQYWDVHAYGLLKSDWIVRADHARRSKTI